MPINYQDLKKHCQEANIQAIKQELLLDNPNEQLDSDQIDDITEIVKDLIDNAATTLSANQYSTVLELIRRRRLPLFRDDDQTGQKKLYAYTSSQAATVEEDATQRRVNERFFRTRKALKPQSPSEQLHGLITAELAKPLASRAPLALDGYSSRALILAMVKVTQVRGAYPDIKFTIGNTTLVCTQAEDNGNVRQRANHWVEVEQLPDERFTYGNWESRAGVKSVCRYLEGLCGDNADRQKQLAKKIKEKSHTISSFSYQDFNEHFLIKLDGENSFNLGRFRTAAQRNAGEAKMSSIMHYMNGLTFLYTECEVSRRLYRDHPNGEVHNYHDHAARESDRMPMGIFQAEALSLLEDGKISLNDLFGQNRAVFGATQWRRLRDSSITTGGEGHHRAQYGVATGKSTIEHIDIMKMKARYVNDLVGTNVTSLHSLSLFSYADPEITEQNYSVKQGHNVMKGKLSDHFGGGADSDASDYSDDDAEIQNLGGGLANMGI